MKRQRICLPVLLLLGGLLDWSCKKVIEVDIRDAKPALVIEASITNQTDSQVVRLSRSVPFGEVNGFNSVSDALVRVTDENGLVYTFRERSPGIYSNRRLTGVPGTRYLLEVELDGQEYSAVSTMPQQVQVDSVGISVTTIFDRDQKSVQLLFTDPPGKKNYYRYRLEINDQRSRNMFPFNDDFTDGRRVTRELFDLDLDAKTGDTARVEMQCIDAAMYRYFQGVDQNENRGGASTTPANPLSNISNGALGYFSAHTVQREVIIIP